MNRMSLPKMSAVFALLFMSCLPVSAQPAKPNRVIEHVSPVAPESLDDLWSHAAIIVVAQVGTATPAPRTAMGGVPDVYTSYTTHIIETLKGSLPAGAVLLQKAGIVTMNGV